MANTPQARKRIRRNENRALINGNRLSRTNLIDAAFSESYGYDNLNQLVGFTRGAHNRSWDYDAQGNWQSVTTNGSTQTRTHNAQNEITGISGATTPTYDANGNLTRDETGRQFVYDAWNRLVAVKDSGGATLKAYAYDGSHRRVRETGHGGLRGRCADRLPAEGPVQAQHRTDGLAGQPVDPADRRPRRRAPELHGAQDLASGVPKPGEGHELVGVDPATGGQVLPGEPDQQIIRPGQPVQHSTSAAHPGVHQGQCRPVRLAGRHARLLRAHRDLPCRAVRVRNCRPSSPKQPPVTVD